ncbi:sarcospan-like [Tubulanus polymorphus]|uniref:sarcospan-like n=1 Tax=Tubulanus polymorphus TaxID=672921 RepID=UPI003DA62C48
MNTRGKMTRGSPLHAGGYQQIQSVSRNNLGSTGHLHDLVCNHRGATTGRRFTRRQSTLQQHKENMELRCCRITVLLVIMQTFLGIIITALGFYLRRLTLSIPLIETPFWAGIPLSLAGAIGMYLCAYDFKVYTGKKRIYSIKAVCAVISSTCVVACLVGSVFTGIHGHRIAAYTICDRLNSSCICSLQEPEPSVNRRMFVYEGMKRCTLVFSSLKDYLILQCALNTVASGVSLWFVLLLWRSRYRPFYGGLRLFSYSANQPSHPLTYSPTSETRAAVRKSAVNNQQHSPITHNPPIANKTNLTPSPVLQHTSRPFPSRPVYIRNSILDDFDDSPVMQLHANQNDNAHKAQSEVYPEIYVK